MNITVDYNIISPYIVMIILSIVISFYIAYRNMIQNKIEQSTALYTIMTNLAFTLYGATMMTFIASGFKRLGLSSLGGAIGLLLSAYMVSRIADDKEYIILKSYAINIPLMYSISKIGCLLVGCCYGKAYSGILRIRYSGRIEQIPSFEVFPIQLLESIVFIVIYIAIMVLYKRKFKYTIETMLILSSLAKGILDVFRYKPVEQFISINQIICIIIFIISIVSIVLKNKEHKNK